MVNEQYLIIKNETLNTYLDLDNQPSYNFMTLDRNSSKKQMMRAKYIKYTSCNCWTYHSVQC